MVFDPLLIIYQIATLQCLYYFVFGSLLLVSNILIGSLLSLDLMFSANYLGAESDYGFLVACPQIVAGLVGGYLLAFVVEKIKKCLDFSVTVWFVHLIVCTAYDGFPNAWGWWVSNGVSFLCMVFLGEYLCAAREMENIPLYTTVNSNKNSSNSSNNSSENSNNSHSNSDSGTITDNDNSNNGNCIDSSSGNLNGGGGSGGASRATRKTGARRKLSSSNINSSSSSDGDSSCASAAGSDDEFMSDADDMSGAVTRDAGTRLSSLASSLTKASSKLKAGMGIASSSSTGSGMELLSGVASKPMPII